MIIPPINAIRWRTILTPPYLSYADVKNYVALKLAELSFFVPVPSPRAGQIIRAPQIQEIETTYRAGSDQTDLAWLTIPETIEGPSNYSWYIRPIVIARKSFTYQSLSRRPPTDTPAQRFFNFIWSDDLIQIYPIVSPSLDVWTTTISGEWTSSQLLARPSIDKVNHLPLAPYWNVS